MNTALINLALPDLAAEIDQAHGQATEHARTAIEHARRCGELLIEAKRQIGHGGFLAWLGKNCRVGERQARNYVKLARNWPAIQARSAPGSVLTVKGALRLVDDRRPARPWRFPIHSFGRIFPWMTKPELNELAGSIRRDGLIDSITLYQGRILDGKCRYRACLIADVAPSFREFRGDDAAALAYVWSMNAMRAHFTQDQRVVMAYKLDELARLEGAQG